MEILPAEISSTIRIPSQTVEFLGGIHKKPIRVLLDSRSTGNYISDNIAHSFNLIVKQEEGYEKVTLTDGSKLQVKEYVFLSIGVWWL